MGLDVCIVNCLFTGVIVLLVSELLRLTHDSLGAASLPNITAANVVSCWLAGAGGWRAREAGSLADRLMLIEPLGGCWHVIHLFMFQGRLIWFLLQFVPLVWSLPEPAFLFEADRVQLLTLVLGKRAAEMWCLPLSWAHYSHRCFYSLTFHFKKCRWKWNIKTNLLITS